MQHGKNYLVYSRLKQLLMVNIRKEAFFSPPWSDEIYFLLEKIVAVQGSLTCNRFSKLMKYLWDYFNAYFESDNGNASRTLCMLVSTWRICGMDGNKCKHVELLMKNGF